MTTPRKKKKKKMSSPLRPLLGALRVLRYLGGFPLEENKSDGVQWHLNKTAWVVSWAAVIVVMSFFM